MYGQSNMFSKQNINLISDAEQLLTIKNAGFKVQDILQYISFWPRIPSGYKLQVLAQEIFTYYRLNPGFAEQLSDLFKKLKETKKDTASYLLWKIMASWLHQDWPTLPCAQLSNEKAFSLFPEHALAPPTIQTPSKPFKAMVSGWRGYMSKVLHRPLEWEGALDSFSALLDVIPPPKKMSVIGFGDGRELEVLNMKWPDTKIYGFEQTQQNEYNSQMDFISSKPNITVHYNNTPHSYAHQDGPIDLALIRHPIFFR